MSFEIGAIPSDKGLILKLPDDKTIKDLDIPVINDKWVDIDNYLFDMTTCEIIREDNE